MGWKLKAAAAGMLLPAAVFAALWWVLAGDRPSSWTVGIPVVAMAAALALAVRRGPMRVSPLGLARFFAYFLRASMLAGLDVARRVLLPAMPIDPEARRFRVRLPEGPARLFFAGVVSLLPGTLSVELEGHELIVHVLDRRQPIDRDLERLEARVADLFAVELRARDGGRDE